MRIGGVSMRKGYSIGLDIGTNSIGYAVITEDYKVPVKTVKVLGNTDKKTIRKNLLGVLLFEEGQTAQGRRLKRTSRRRIERRKNRLRYLQEIFSEEINRVDESFFHRLEESFYTPEDKQYSKHPLFGNQQEEVAYHQEFPTIYHLRQALADNPQQYDIRLVYAAIAHMIKYRGHFLIEGKLDLENNNIQQLFDEFLEIYVQVFKDKRVEDKVILVEEILTAPLSKSAKRDRIMKQYAIDKNSTLSEFLKLIVGNQADFKKYFDLEEKAAVQVTKDSYEEDLDNLLAQIDEDYSEVFEKAKKVYDAMILSNILTVKDVRTHAPLSYAMMNRFNNHQVELEKLKKYFKENLPYEVFRECFRDKDKNGYAGYIEGKTKQDDFYKYLKKLLPISSETEDFLEKIHREDFLRKQRTFDNGAIPHQVHLKELTAILDNQGQFYPFLVEQKEKIMKLLTFRIPYYVGPLARNNNSPFAWVKYHSNQKVTPWNFEEVVDTNASAEQFIQRMTNFDLYLPQEKVLPKHSPLYETFAVYNELTKIQFVCDYNYGNDYQENYFEKSAKEKIVNEVFKKHRKVTKKELLDYLAVAYADFNIVDIKGLDLDTKTFNASLGTYHDLLKIGISQEFLDDEANQSIIEELITILTVFEDRTMIRKRLEAFKPYFSAQVLKKLERRHYTGWGRLSEKLINGLKHNGKTILDYLKEDSKHRNFMQLIHDDDLSFKQQIADAQIVGQATSIEEKVSQLQGSPAIKKGILQSMKIVEELVKIMGHKPNNIVIEMAREIGSSKRTKPRLKQIENILAALDSQLLKEDSVTNQQLQNEKFYLYYLQNGKDMYTGKKIDRERLSDYDVDHIIPYSFLPDDSLDNKALVSSTENRKKGDDVPSIKIVNDRYQYWEKLLKAKAISELKFKRLTKAERGGLTNSDKERFINRQLVETRQITKHVARLLDEEWNTELNDNGETVRTVNIITLKSQLVSNFRKKFNLPKVRELNHYHHAHDAYLNAVVGTALLKMYPTLRAEFVYGEFRRLKKSEGMKALLKAEFYTNITNFFEKNTIFADENGEVIWNKDRHLGVIRKVLSLPQVNVVKKVEEQTGGFANETVEKRGESDKLIPRKRRWDTNKYGGFTSLQRAYAIVFEAEKQTAKKVTRQKEMIGIPIMNREEYEKNPIAYLEQLGYVGVQADKILKLNKYTLLELENGVRRRLVSEGEVHRANEIVLPQHLVELLYHAANYKNKTPIKSDRDEKMTHLDYVTLHRADFGELFEVIMKKAEVYVNKPKAEQKIRETFNKQFCSATIEEICESFVALLTYTSTGASAEFKFFGEKISVLRYWVSNKFYETTLIYQSVTGIFETRVDLSKL